MPKEIGPRERALREQREARFAEAELARKSERQKVESGIRTAAKAGAELLDRVAEASKKRGKPRKAKR
jgi:hypothetical protein